MDKYFKKFTFCSMLQGDHFPGNVKQCKFRGAVGLLWKKMHVSKTVDNEILAGY